ncbi:hypothetical protein E2C01_038918 [Portunus trituberculatus]|uniref:HTH psq-type domain-containing protein n=1 Tax=Portunus trituberculatus TaxID=210409 RepID=A0A5B7FIF8_PORTR|nr:hypothetical protein [Portunus trituberculatus]
MVVLSKLADGSSCKPRHQLDWFRGARCSGTHPSRKGDKDEESDSKKSRKCVTTEKKLEVLDHYAREENTSVIVHAMGLRESTLHTIRADKMRMGVFIVCLI